MRRGVTALVVVVVAAIALAAGVDALRGDDKPQPAAQPASTTTEAPEASPVGEGREAGVLYYTDDACRLQAAELPDLAPAEAPNWDECEFALSPDALRVAGAGSGWDPHSDPRRGRLYESADGTIQVSTNGGPEGEPFEGVAPAWKPDGTLSYFAGGAVRTWPDGDVVLSQRDLVRALRPVLGGRFDRLRAREAAWLDDGRLAAIFSAVGPSSRMDLLAIYDGTELGPFTFDAAGALSDLRVSPGGRYAAAKSTGGRDAPFVLLESGRGELRAPEIVGYRALAWSPDDRLLAIAGDDGVFVYRPGVPGQPDLELDVDAQDLDWRREPGAPDLAAADEARDWLGRVGGTGRLLVTRVDQDACRLHALRLPDLTWADEPDGVRAPCRFLAGPQSGQVAACDDEQVCPIGRTPDGRVAFVRDGELFVGAANAPPELVLGTQALGRIFGRSSTLEEVAWYDDERFWAVVRSGPSAMVALMKGDSLVFSPSFTSRAIEGLEVSATGMVAARTDQGVVFFDTGGRRALTFPNGQAVAWAPGELFAAVATPTEILFVAPVSREVLSLPLEVRDLKWVVP